VEAQYAKSTEEFVKYTEITAALGTNYCHFGNKMLRNRHFISHKIVVCRWQKTMEMDVITETKAEYNE
jgi:hypothetical protein